MPRLASWPVDTTFVALGLVVGLLVGATGVGAGSLVTPALIGVGVPPAVAVGTDLAYAALSKTCAAMVHGARRTLEPGIALLLAAGSVPAALLGIGVLGATGAHASSPLVTGALALALALTALALLAGRARLAALASRYERRIAPLRAPLTVVAGAALGILVALSSVGAGALGAVVLVALYPALPAARVAGIDIAHAVPLTLVAALGHAWLGTVDYALAANLLAGAVPGIVAGSLAAGRLPDALLRRLLAFVLLFAGARLAAAGF
jgi:uncharacterized membrane protein YfcA